MNFEHGRLSKDSCFDFLHKNVCKVPDSYSENRHRFFKPSPLINVSSLSTTTAKKREFSVDSGTSPHIISKSDLTPEEKETFQTSTDQSVDMTANGIAHTTVEAKVQVCDLDMCVQVQFWISHPQYFRLVHCAKKMGTRNDGIQVSHHVSSRMG